MIPIYQRILRIKTNRNILLLAGLFTATSAYSTNLVIATVNNGQMLQLQALSRNFEETHPDINIRWITLKEGELRQYVSSDIVTQAGLFDIITVGMYEVPLWAQHGWLKPFRPQPGYDLDDMLDTIRDGLSFQDRLYAAPLYGESSMLMYRKDLLKKAGLNMPHQPTWPQLMTMAAALHDPSNQINGICLRGNPGWGENVTLITTMVNAFGGQWFDMKWMPKLDSKPWRDAVNLYVEALQKYGPRDAAYRGYNENLALFQAGNCALWVDASVAAGFISDPVQSKWAGEVGFSLAPSAVTTKGSHWLWAWALAIPASIDPGREEAAQSFISWATSRDYIQLVASEYGWQLAPAGTRKSTYANPDFQRAAPWAAVELAAIMNANPHDATLPKSPYIGVQYAVIPEFRLIGDTVGELITNALAGQITVDDALTRGQYVAKRQMQLGGYHDQDKVMRNRNTNTPVGR